MDARTYDEQTSHCAMTIYRHLLYRGLSRLTAERVIPEALREFVSNVQGSSPENNRARLVRLWRIARRYALAELGGKEHRGRPEAARFPTSGPSSRPENAPRSSAM